MATRRYSLNIGDNDQQVTEAVGAAVATKSIELTVDLASSPAPSRYDVLKALEYFEHWILKSNWPPA